MILYTHAPTRTPSPIHPHPPVPLQRKYRRPNPLPRHKPDRTKTTSNQRSKSHDEPKRLRHKRCDPLPMRKVRHRSRAATGRTRITGETIKAARGKAELLMRAGAARVWRQIKPNAQHAKADDAREGAPDSHDKWRSWGGRYRLSRRCIGSQRQHRRGNRYVLWRRGISHHWMIANPPRPRNAATSPTGQ